MPRKMLTLAVALALGGCMTAQQWTKNPPLTTVNDDRAFGGDNLVAFGQVSEDHPPLQAGSLILVGQIYWFAVNKAESAELMRVLTSDLPRQFLFTDQSGSNSPAKSACATTPPSRRKSPNCRRWTSSRAKSATSPPMAAACR